MTRDHPVMGFTRWFAWHRVPVTDGKTAWLCFVERGIFWNGTCAFWVWRMPELKSIKTDQDGARG